MGTRRNYRALVAAGLLLVAMLAAAASTQKAGGTLTMYTVDSPASMSILSLCEGVDDPGQQHHQWLAYGRCLAPQVAGSAASAALTSAQSCTKTGVLI